MQLKKIFFPIGGGEELAERIHGALLVIKFSGTNITIWPGRFIPRISTTVRRPLKGGGLRGSF